MRNHSYENDFDLHENEAACRTHFHMKGFALRLVLKQGHKRTRKWPIWSDTWGMCLNIPKCKAMNISRKKIPTKREYHLNGFPLETVSEVKDLGTIVTNTLQWSQHIKLISSKANRTLGLIRRVCRDITDPDTK